MPHALTYDTLPPHSTLRREIVGDAVTITAAAEEPPARARREQLQRSALSGALLSGALLAAFILAIGSTYIRHRQYMDTPLFAMLVVAFVVFCGALFGFVWRAQYAARLDALEQAMRQTTILAASPGRLLVETAGPFGQASYDLVGATLEFRRARCDGRAGIDCLEIRTADVEPIRILPGRDAQELRWVAQTLNSTIRRV